MGTSAYVLTALLARRNGVEIRSHSRCHGHWYAKATVETFGCAGPFGEVYQHPVVDGLGASIAIDRLRLLIGIVAARSGWHGWLQANG